MSYTANTPTVLPLYFLSTSIASTCSQVLWHPTATVRQHLSKMWSLSTPTAVVVIVVMICRLILQHWQDQSCFPWWLQPTLCALAPSPTCTPGNWIIRESFTDYSSSIISWYLRWLFIYCHLIHTAQSPKGTSGSRMWGRVSSCKPLLVAETELPGHFCSQPVIWKSLVQTKTWQRNAVFTEKTHFSLLLWRRHGLEDEMLLLSEDCLPEPQSNQALCLDLDFPRTTTLHEFKIIQRKERHKWGVCGETDSTQIEPKQQGAFCRAGEEKPHGARMGRLGWLGKQAGQDAQRSRRDICKQPVLLSVPCR